ncbi:hypothetical protein LEP1GSC018_3899 [Leptospira kirschneri str. 2008720114]|uniref:Uncharacterized protein n=1 Tax=Leptospira kirschneri str. 200802841 TaxID=1193047 RepID=A0A828Y8S2_9LEPT|nr:hypothetical protein LEP1GSC131_4448 [Leptospira kirschneri str. 200802841]EKP05563.1 hypothetical protein LEP1GSC018_3899 [Leptospira kirschneri str. 2008720114]EMK17855.1 hypothetical protein LEP1GSC042_2990 [Leptospira kirschneri serovar Bim str. PUO 1247]EMN05272.1 hypothetical protein LEP1GSC046_2949 [Leptospira kirschneri serovar Bim str. 1051]EMN27153.1 hypothetical protein LEP1GSC065_0503 [Leptospira kirschneri serovar Sokoine str. RM1]EMO81794.1 hypothetical protein LEP1GSC126_3278
MYGKEKSLSSEFLKNVPEKFRKSPSEFSKNFDSRISELVCLQ